MRKQININYPYGEINVDIVAFVCCHNINDIRLLIKNVVTLSPDKHKIKLEMLKAIDKTRETFHQYRRYFLALRHPTIIGLGLCPPSLVKDYAQYCKRWDKLTEFLDKYIKD